jgi:hypothetical protein
VKPKSARTYAVGAPNVPKPLYPKDDSTVSKPKTPANYQARGCIYCGSTMHWDRDCKYNKDKKIRSARTMFIDSDCAPEDILGEMEYERCYGENLGLHETSEGEIEEVNEEDVSDSKSDQEESEGSDF